MLKHEVMDALINLSGEKQTIEWLLCLRVTFYNAEFLDYSDTKGLPPYHDLNAYKVLFDEDGDPHLSCFGTNHAYRPSEYLKNGRVTSASVVYSFGTVLRDLLSGNHIPPNHALDTIRGENLNLVMDSHLEGKFSSKEAAEAVGLASQCLQYEPRQWPSIKDLVVILARLQTKSDVPSNVMLQISKCEEALSIPQCLLSPLAEACLGMDLTAIYRILVMAHYRDDKEAHELSFQEWPQQMRDMLEARKEGDTALRDKDFKTDYHCQCTNVNIMLSPTVCAPLSLRHVFSDQSDAALLDAMQDQCAHPDWPTAFCMQPVAF